MMKEQTGISERVQAEAAPDTMKAGTAEPAEEITKAGAAEAGLAAGIPKARAAEAEPAAGITKAGTTEAEPGITRGEADESVSGQGGTSETVQAEEQAKQSRGSLFEGIYDQLPDISVRSVDRFIILCVIALIAVILIGVLKANHIF